MLALAMAYNKVAADAGYEPAEIVEGAVLEQGRYGVAKDAEAGARYFRRAALAGNTDGEMLLGLKLLTNTPSPGKAADGVKWLVLAERDGCAEGGVLLGRVSSMLAPATIVAGAHLADDWMKIRPPRDPHIHAEDRRDGCPASELAPPPRPQPLPPAGVTKTSAEDAGAAIRRADQRAEAGEKLAAHAGVLSP